MESAEIVQLIWTGLGIAATVAAITPNKSDNVAIQAVYSIINLLGQNVRNAKNKD